MADVFISYSRQDTEEAASLARKLDALGYSIWWDTQLVAGSKYRLAILEQLQIAGTVLVLWSRSSVQSHFVEDEAERARGAGKLIPLRTSELPVNQIPIGFGAYETLLFDNFPGIAAAIAVKGVKPSLTTSENECNMFSFFGECGKIRKGIESKLHTDPDQERSFRAIDAATFYLGSNMYRMDAYGYDVIPEDFVTPPRFSIDEDFIAGTIITSKDGRRISTKQPGEGNIVRVFTGPWDKGDPQPIESHGSMNCDGTTNCLVLGVSVGSQINVRRSGVWRLPVGATILVKGSVPDRMYRLVSANAMLFVETVTAISYYKELWDECFPRVIRSVSGQA